MCIKHGQFVAFEKACNKEEGSADTIKLVINKPMITSIIGDEYTWVMRNDIRLY